MLSETWKWPAGKPRRQRLLAFTAALAFIWQGHAELPTARLQSIFPLGGRSGTTFDLTIEGADLDDASRLYFSAPGIISERKFTNFAGSSSCTFTITISSNVLPGLYETRVAGRFGISNPRFFTVGDLAEMTGGNENRSLATALALPLETTVNAFAQSAAADFYKFEAKKGQRVLITCQGEPFDSKMKPVLVVYDHEGREQQRNRRDHLIDLHVKESGTYSLKVHDLVFRGGKQFGYRLTVSTRPYIDFVFPPAGEPGSSNRFAVYGRNLPGGERCAGLAINDRSLENISVDMPMPNSSEEFLRSAAFLSKSAMNSVIDSVDCRIPVPRALNSPLVISLATAAPVLEQEPNNNSGQAQRISVPCEIQGQFYPRDNVDWYEFQATKGDTFWIEIFSQRLGQPTDPFILVQKVTRTDKGEPAVSDLQEMYDSDVNLGGTLFNTSSRDPAWRLEVKEDSSYRLQVRDLFNHQSDPSRIYRLSVRRETPDFRLVALVEPPPTFEKDKREAQMWSSFLRRSDSLLVKVLALRRDNFGGEIALHVANLPSEVHASQSVVREGQNAAWLSLTAAENASEWWGSIQIIGKATVRSSEIVRPARAATVVWNVQDYNNEAVQSRLLQELMLGVSLEPIPCKLEPAQLTWQAAPADTVPISLRLLRTTDFGESVKLRAYVDAQNAPIKEWEVDGKATQTSFELDLKQAKLEPGTHQLFVLAQTKGKMRRVRPDEVSSLEAASRTAEEQKKRAEQELNEIAKQTDEDTIAKRKAIEKRKELAIASAKQVEERLQLREVTGIFNSPIMHLVVTPPPPTK